MLAIRYTVSMAKILIVEDEAELREILGRYLEKQGYSVLLAENGVRGLSMAQESKPDLILLDVKMPEMTGFQMIKNLRKTGEWGEHVPVIFLTNIIMQDDEEQADIESTEPAGYIVKSKVDPEDVLKKIQDVLNKQSN